MAVLSWVTTIKLHVLPHPLRHHSLSLTLKSTNPLDHIVLGNNLPKFICPYTQNNYLKKSVSNKVTSFQHRFWQCCVWVHFEEGVMKDFEPCRGQMCSSIGTSPRQPTCNPKLSARLWHTSPAIICTKHAQSQESLLFTANLTNLNWRGRSKKWCVRATELKHFS